MSILGSIRTHLSPVYNIAKKYYKLRLKVLEISDSNKKIELLNMLNQIQPILNTLEIEKLSNIEKQKFIKQIKSVIEKIGFLLKNKTNENIVSKKINQ